MMLRPKSATQKLFKDFFENNQDLSNKRAPKIMFLHINHITVPPHNHLFLNEMFPQGKIPFKCLSKEA